jgi:hypothetical protein
MRIPALVVLILAAALIVASGAAFAQELPGLPGLPSITPSTPDEVIGLAWGVAKVAVVAGGFCLLTILTTKLPKMLDAKIDEWTAAARKLRTELVDQTLDTAIDAGADAGAAARTVLDQLPNTARSGKWSAAQLEQRAHVRKVASERRGSV